METQLLPNPQTTSDFRDRFSLDFSEIHGSVFPADVREEDRIVARIRKRVADSSFESIRIWRVSPLGIELVQNENSDYVRGDKIDLEVTIGGQRTHFEGLVVDLVQKNEEISLIGIRLSNRGKDVESTTEKRRTTRWICSDDFFPTCISPTPGRFNEYIYFQIRDISEDGFQLICSLRNKYLIPGMQLNLTASFPMVGDLSLTVCVTRVGIISERGKDYLVVGTEFISLGKNSKNVIGQYLLQFTDAETLDDLRSADFFPKSVAKGTDFYFLKSESDYEEVLNLRLAAHLAGNTIDSESTAAEMGDIFDTNSRIIVGKCNGKIIASARVRFNVLDQPMEHEQYFNWPAHLPRRDQVFEITRTVTHPNFRRNDLLAALLQFISATCVQPQRPWVLFSSTDKLLSFYTKAGFKQTGISYNHPTYRGKQNVLVTNVHDFLLGRSSHPMYWNMIWGDVYSYLVDSGIIIPEPMDRARIRAYKLYYPIASVLYKLSSRLSKS